jgi:hypothetical protein
MSWLEFASNIIDNVLSWPVAVFLIVLLMRKQIRELLLSVENFVVEAGGTRVSLTRSLERANEVVAAAKADLLPPPNDSDAAERTEVEHLELPSIGWQLFILDSSQSDPIALPAFLDTYATRLLTEPLNSTYSSPGSGFNAYLRFFCEGFA